jgi:hypothetical protein
LEGVVHCFEAEPIAMSTLVLVLYFVCGERTLTPK